LVCGTSDDLAAGNPASDSGRNGLGKGRVNARRKEQRVRRGEEPVTNVVLVERLKLLGEFR